jgi:hypothetical protein
LSTNKQTIKHIVKTFPAFTERGGGIAMRSYQLTPAKAIIDSVIHKKGLTFVVIMSRQAGKDELIGNLLAFLCNLFAHRDVGIVVANPTYKPQTINAIMRFEKRLSTNLITKIFWSKRSDFMRMIGNAVVSFLSGDGSANVVGATASLALIINEAQDIEPSVYDKKFAPMVASTNATRLITGTTWTSKTLLAREMHAALELEKQDGIKRVFIYNADAVRKIVPAYGTFIDNEVKKLGRQHPLVKTQYFCEEIDELTGMFNAARRALMIGDLPPSSVPRLPVPGHIYALTIDVGGQDEALLNLDGMGNPGRDYTTLNIVDIDLSTLEDLQAPTYRVVNRFSWQGQNHVSIFGMIKATTEVWNAQYIVIDSIGVGEGLWAMAAKRFPTKTIPVKFSQQTKSELGYAFIGMIETGRFRDCAPSVIVDEQYANCESEILIGPAKTMRWGVKDGTRNSAGQLIHDDHITADAMTAELDKLEWYVPAETTIIEQADVLEEMSNAF